LAAREWKTQPPNICRGSEGGKKSTARLEDLKKRRKKMVFFFRRKKKGKPNPYCGGGGGPVRQPTHASKGRGEKRDLSSHILGKKKEKGTLQRV